MRRKNSSENRLRRLDFAVDDSAMEYSRKSVSIGAAVFARIYTQNQTERVCIERITDAFHRRARGQPRMQLHILNDTIGERIRIETFHQ